MDEEQLWKVEYINKIFSNNDVIYICNINKLKILK